MIISNASYSCDFSTILRVVKASKLDTDIADQKTDGFGRSPLPKYLENARLDIWSEKKVRRRQTSREVATSSP